ncbi:MAG: hypothetical protein JWM78_2503 [Verrucomicrobiaceae bacterium]|nr:hypothetical protein [Verrucomicrobiaceae bacterium]
MSISMYELTVPVFTHNLTNLIAILEKGAAFSEAKNIDPSVLPNSRLAPDMHPLKKQVQITSDNVKGALARLAGVELPSWEDNENTFAELIARVQKTIDYTKTFKAAQIDGSENKAIELKLGPSFEMNFEGMGFLQLMVLPNFYFHLSTTYDILRHNGVDLGKRDLLGKIQ